MLHTMPKNPFVLCFTQSTHMSYNKTCLLHPVSDTTSTKHKHFHFHGKRKEQTHETKNHRRTHLNIANYINK